MNKYLDYLKILDSPKLVIEDNVLEIKRAFSFEDMKRYKIYFFENDMKISISFFNFHQMFGRSFYIDYELFEKVLLELIIEEKFDELMRWIDVRSEGSNIKKRY